MNEGRFTPAELEAFRQQRIEHIEREGKLRRVACPKCPAQIGEPCYSATTYYIGDYHRARKDLAGVR